MSARIIPNFDTAESIFKKYEEEINSSVERLKAIYNNRYEIIILISNNGYMTIVAPYYYGEKVVIGYNKLGKAIYSDKLSANRLKILKQQYLVYKIV